MEEILKQMRQREKKREYYQKNKEELTIKRRKNYEDNKEKIREYMKEYMRQKRWSLITNKLKQKRGEEWQYSILLYGRLIDEKEVFSEQDLVYINNNK